MSANEGHEKDLVNTAVFVFAHYLGIDLERDQDLIWIAEEAFEKLPEGWEFGVSEEGDHAGIPYFYNSVTGESVWNHPDEDKYKRKLKRERQLKKDNNRGSRRSSLGRDSSGSTAASQSPSPQPTDRNRDSNRSSNTNQTRAQKELTMVEEVVDFDQDEIPLSSSEPIKATTTANTTNNKNTTTSNSRPAFGLSEDDFYDPPAAVSGGGGGSRRDREYSPPLFKDLKLDSNNNNTTRNNNNLQQSTAGRSGSGSSSNNQQQTQQQGQGGQSQGQGGGDRWFRVPGDNNQQQAPQSSQSQSQPQQSGPGRGGSGSSGSGSGSGGRTEATVQEVWDSRKNNNSNNNNKAARGGDRNDRDNTNSSRSPVRQQSSQQSQSQQVVTVIDETALYQAQQAAQQILTQQQQSLTQQVSLLQTQHTQNIQSLRDDLRLAEQRLNEEKVARISVENHLQRAQSDLLRVQRQSEEANELKLRDSLRKAKVDLEDEYRERIRAIERKSLEDLDSNRQEISSLKRKYDESLREMDLLKRRNLQSKDEGRLDAENEILSLKQSIRDLDEENNRLKVEMKRSKEEIANQFSRVAANQLIIQQQAMELESLRLSQQQVIHESQIQAAAFMQASQRLAMNESEFATYKAENASLRSKNDQLEIELKRLRGSTNISHESLIANEAEMKRSKLSLQQEIQRMAAKLAESEAVTRLLRDENSKFQTDETQALRSLRNQLDSVESEKSRLVDSNATCKLTIDELQTRIRKMETDSVLLQEQSYRKDRALREETQRLENLQNSIFQIRSEYETTVTHLKNQLTQSEDKILQMERKYQEKVVEIQQEVSDRVPRLISQAIEQSLQTLQTQHNDALHEQRLQYESTLSKRRHELLEMQASFAEQLAKERLRGVEERAELDRLRAKVGVMQQQMAEMENALQQHNHQQQLLQLSYGNDSMVAVLQQQTQQYQGQQQQQQSQQRTQPTAARNSHNNKSMSMSRLYDESMFDFSSLLPPPPSSAPQQQQQLQLVQQQQQQSQQQDDNMVVVRLTQELASMKQTLSRALNSNPRHQIVNSSIDTGGIMPTTMTLSMMEAGEAERKESHNSSNSQRMKTVSFKPESLFHSPQPASRAGAGAGGQRQYYGINTSSYITRDNDDHQQQQQHDGHENEGDHEDMLGSTLGSTLTLNMTENNNNNKPNTRSSAGGLPPRYSHYEPMSSPAMSASYPNYSNNINSSSRQQQAAASLSLIDFDQSMMNNNNNSYLSQSLSVLPRDQEELFEGIRDGGYHEGYWRAKYSVNIRR